jgi:hypothetical protein
MTKRANHSTQLNETTKHPKQQLPPAAQTGKNEADARDDEKKLAENQRDLGVDKGHKTDEMKKRRRGTFP